MASSHDAAVSRLVLSCKTIQEEIGSKSYPVSLFAGELKLALERLIELSTARVAAAEKASIIELDLKNLMTSLAEIKAECDESQNSAKGLQEDYEKFTQDQDEYSTRIQRSQRTLNERSAVVATLEAKSLNAKSWSKEQEEAREELEHRRDSALEALTVLKRQLGDSQKKEADLREAVERLEEERSSLDARIVEEKGEVEALRAEASAALRKKDAKERAVESERKKLALLTKEREALKITVAEGIDQASKRATALSKERGLLDKYVRDVERAGKKTTSLQRELEDTYSRNAGLARELETQGKELGLLESEEGRVRKETDKVKRLSALAIDKTKELDSEIASEEEVVASLLRKLGELDVSLAAANRAAAASHAAVSDTRKEKEVLAKGLSKQGDKTKAAAAAKSYQTSALKAAQVEVSGYIASVKGLREECRKVELAKEEQVALLSQASGAYFEVLERGRLSGEAVVAWESKVVECRESQQKAESQLLSARALRSAARKAQEELEKKVLGAQGDVGLLNVELRRCKGEIGEGDAWITKTHFEKQKMEVTLEELGHTRVHVRACISEEKEKLALILEECARLREVEAGVLTQLHRCNLDREAKRSTRDAALRSAKQAKDVVSTLKSQVNGLRKHLQGCAIEYASAVGTRGKLEAVIASLKAKIEVSEAEAYAADGGLGGGLQQPQEQHESAEEGELQHSDRPPQPQKPQEQLQALRETPRVQVASAFYSVREEILRANTEMTVLSEELKRPINLHRWRGIAESDPEKFSMLRRLHEYQKRCIEARDKEILLLGALEEAQRGLERARVLASKAPGSSPEHEETCAALSSELKEKHRQLREVEVEREAAAARVKEWQSETSRAVEALEALDSAYVKAAKKAGRERRGTVTGLGGPNSGGGLAGVGDNQNNNAPDVRIASSDASLRAKTVNDEADRLFLKFGVGQT